MPKITSKGQVTIPQNIRNRFGFIPGMDVEIIVEGNKALIVKSRDENTHKSKCCGVQLKK